MSNHDPHSFETYFVSSFVSCLTEDLRPMVKNEDDKTTDSGASNRECQIAGVSS